MKDRCSCGVLISLIDRHDLQAHVSACGLVVPEAVLAAVERRRRADQRRRQRYERHAWLRRKALAGVGNQQESLRG